MSREWGEVKEIAALRDRIAAVQAKHHHWDYAGSLTCACGDAFGLDTDARWWEAAVQDWSLHVADAVIAELGLRPAESLDRRFIRWVTAWRNNPELGGEHDE